MTKEERTRMFWTMLRLQIKLAQMGDVVEEATKATNRLNEAMKQYVGAK